MSNFMTLNRAYERLIHEQNGAGAPKGGEREEAVEREDIEMRLSSNLAVELTETLNAFTAVCAKVVKSGYATSDTLDRLEGLYSKIKDLISAGKNSVSK